MKTFEKKKQKNSKYWRHQFAAVAYVSNTYTALAVYLAPVYFHICKGASDQLRRLSSQQLRRSTKLQAKDTRHRCLSQRGAQVRAPTTPATAASLALHVLLPPLLAAHLGAGL